MFLFDFLFPRCCLGCGQEGRYFCPSCLKLIKPLENLICPACEKPAIHGRIHPHCQTKYGLDGLVSIFPYDGLPKIAIGKLKYHFVTDLIEEFINLTLSYWPSLETKKASLIPIPLFWQRENWRGFNQAELLGRKIARAFNWEVKTNILIRQKFTFPQVDLKEEERQKNIKNAFRLDPNWKLGNRNWKFIVFDDVWTTGSTLKEACKTLKKAGVKKVYGLTICR